VPAATGAQVPSAWPVSAAAQEAQSALQEASQQNPSTQKPL
jgi:hypothetical protein